MKNIKTIFFKELKRFFTEPRMLAALFLPGVLIFFLYMIMGNAISGTISSTSTTVENTTFNVAYSNNFGTTTDHDSPFLMTYFDTYLEQEAKGNTAVYTTFDKDDAESYKEALEQGTYDVVVVFSDDFDLQFYNYLSKESNNISLFYNGSSKASYYSYSILYSLTSAIYDTFTINNENGTSIPANVSSSDYLMSMMISMMFPMITVSLLFSTVISICPESIAGEKERGTLSSLLLTPIKRWQLALGKIAALTVTAFASGTISFLGLLLSLPQLMGVSLATAFTPSMIVLLFFLIITALFLFIAVGLLVSSFAKSVREAGSYLGPLMTVFILLSLIPAFGDITNIGFAFIPILDIVSCMSMLISNTAITTFLPYFVITIVMNVLLTAGLVILIAHLFKKEKVMLTN